MIVCTKWGMSNSYLNYINLTYYHTGTSVNPYIFDFRKYWLKLYNDRLWEFFLVFWRHKHNAYKFLVQIFHYLYFEVQNKGISGPTKMTDVLQKKCSYEIIGILILKQLNISMLVWISLVILMIRTIISSKNWNKFDNKKIILMAWQACTRYVFEFESLFIYCV